MGVETNRFLCGIIVIGVGLLILSTPVQARPLTVCSHLGFEPYVIHEDKTVKGLDVDIVSRALRGSGYEAKFVYLPWLRLLRSLENGSCDIGYSLFDRENRRADMHYFYDVPVHFSTFQVFTLLDRKFPYQEVEDLFGMKVAFNRGFAMTHELDKALATNKVEKVEYDSVNSAFNMLFAGRVDAIIDNQTRIKYFLRHMALKNKVRNLDIPFFPYRPAFLVFSKRSTFPDLKAVRERVATEMIRMEKSGEIEAIKASYTN